MIHKRTGLRTVSKTISPILLQMAHWIKIYNTNDLSTSKILKHLVADIYKANEKRKSLLGPQIIPESSLNKLCRFSETYHMRRLNWIHSVCHTIFITSMSCIINLLLYNSLFYWVSVINQFEIDMKVFSHRKCILYFYHANASHLASTKNKTTICTLFL